MKKYLLVLGMSCALLSVGAGKKKEKLPELMHYFYQTLLEMKPLMTNFEDFKDTKNKAHVLEIEKLFVNLAKTNL